MHFKQNVSLHSTAPITNQAQVSTLSPTKRGATKNLAVPARKADDSAPSLR